MTTTTKSEMNPYQYPDGDWSYFNQTLTPTQKNILPRDKFDHDRVNHLSSLSVSELQPLIPDILSWMQDMNRPIGFPVAEFLLRNPGAVLPSIHVLLCTKLERRIDGSYDFDYEWQNNVLCHLVAKMPRQVAGELKSDLQLYRARISDEAERDYEIRETVDEILKSLEAVTG